MKEHAWLKGHTDTGLVEVDDAEVKPIAKPGRQL